MAFTSNWHRSGHSHVMVTHDFAFTHMHRSCRHVRCKMEDAGDRGLHSESAGSLEAWAGGLTLSPRGRVSWA